MDINVLREAVTVLSLVAFLGIVAYAAYPGNRKRFDEAARLPLDEDKESRPSSRRAPEARGAGAEGGSGNGSTQR